jgi:hypothetical protein
MVNLDTYILPLIDNIVVLMGLIGVILTVSSPAYFIHTFRKRGNITRPMVALLFGISFFYMWLRNSPLAGANG